MFTLSSFSYASVENKLGFSLVTLTDISEYDKQNNIKSKYARNEIKSKIEISPRFYAKKQHQLTNYIYQSSEFFLGNVLHDLPCNLSYD